MILDAIACECGSDRGWRIDMDMAECWECGETVPRGVQTPTMLGRFFMKGDGDNGGVYVKQLGRRFHSEKEMMAYAESQGLEPVAPNSERWKSVKANNRNEADKDAKRDGFSSADERANLIRNNKKDMLARAREKKIEEYHEEHGSDGKQTLEEAFGDLP